MKKILWILIFLSGCATSPLQVIKAPYELFDSDTTPNLNNLTSSSKVSEQLAGQFLSALSNLENNLKGDACKQFTKLSESPYSPIRDAATIKLMEKCELSSNELIKIWQSFTPQDFAQERYFEVAYQLAHKYELNKFELQFINQLINFKKNRVEKIALLKSGKYLAEKINDKKSLSAINEKLLTLSPRLQTEITSENKFAIAKDFESNRQFTEARKLYAEIIASSTSSFDEKLKTLNANRMSYKVERDLKTFLLKTTEMRDYLKQLYLENSTDTKIADAWGDAEINLARAVWTEHRPDEASKILIDFIKTNASNQNQLANAHLILGLINIEGKNSKNALDYFIKANEFKISDNSLKENIQWAITWNSYLLKKYKDVSKYAIKFARPSPNPYFYNKLYFWKGIAEKKSNAIEDARDTFQKLFEADPFGYYGILASIELNTSLTKLNTVSMHLDSSGNDILDWLIILKEKELARKVLKDINPKFKTYNDREKAMQLYLRTDWFQAGMAQINNFPVKKRNALTEKYIGLIFPTPNLELVNKAAKRFKVPSELILAITRQESAFSPTERSWADAFGLMQMIPERAKVLSKKYSIPYTQVEDLYDPAINIEMGTALLSELIKSYKGKFAQTVAAYNASPDAIKTWERERFNGNYLEFIEMIPYEETRNYIKLVFRNYVTYKRLLAEKEIKLDSNFFEHSFFQQED